MSPSLRQRLFSNKSRESPPALPAHTVELSASTATTLAPDSDNDPAARLSPAPSDSETQREHESSLNTTLTNSHRVPFYRRRTGNKSETALSSSTTKSQPPHRRRGKQSFLSRVVQRVVPCVPDAPTNPELANGDPNPISIPTVLIMPPIQSEPPPTPPRRDSQIIVPPSPAQLLPLEETGGITSGAVQPPGEPIARIPTRDSDNSDATSYMDDGDDDMDVFDEQAEEERLIRNGGAGIPIGSDGKPKALLPPLAPEHVGRKCLVLDLDETLVHSSFRPVPNADFIVPVEIELAWHQFHILKRPGVDRFLQIMGEHYEIVVYTASLSKYADPVLDKLDIHHVVNHRLFRESCFNHKGNYVKDLSQLGRPIADTIILDNSPASYIFHPNNAVPVSSWFNDPHDAELPDLIPFLVDLTSVPDVRGILNPSR